MSCTSCRQATCTGCCSSASATPYYNCTDVCPEDHTEYVNCNRFYFALQTTTSWNVPLCGGSSTISVPGVKDIHIGSYIWSKTFGYFEVVGFNVSSGTVTVQNNCNDGNATPGTQIPACSDFVVVDPPADSGSSSTDACLAVDFTAPEEDVPLDITVTGTTGLTAGDTIQIGTGFYFLEAIKPNNIITIINKGEGIVPGTPVIAKDSTGNPQYCFSVISTNPCDKEAITAGRLLACAGDSSTAPLGGCQIGYTPVVVDEDCNVELRPVEEAPVCARLTEALEIVNGDATYTLTVSDTSEFIVGDMLSLPGVDERFVVDVITDATHLNVVATPTPSADATVAIGSLLCTITCCENTETRLSLQGVDVVEAEAVTPATANTGRSGNIAYSGAFANTSSSPLAYVATLEFFWAGLYVDNNSTDDIQANLGFRPYYATASGPIGTTANPVPVLDPTGPLADSINIITGGAESWTDWNWGQSHSYQLSGTIAPGEELRISAQAVLEVINLNLGSIYSSVLGAKITTLRITTA